MGLTERLSVLVDAQGGGAIRTFREIGSEAQKAYGKVAKAQQDSTASTGRLGKALSSLGISSSTALKAGVAAGATAAAVAITKFVQGAIAEYARYGAEVRRVARITGASAEDSSRLAVAFKTLGIDVDRGGTAMFRFLKNVETSGPALKSFGVEVVKNKAGVTQTIPTLLNLADAYSRTTSPSKRAELASAAFGARIGTELLPALSKGRAGLEALLTAADKFGLVMSAKDLQATLQYTMATRHMGEAFEGLKLQAGRSFVGVATNVAEFGTAFALGAQKEARFIGGVLGHIPGVHSFANAIHDVAANAQQMGAALHGALGNLPKELQQSLSSQSGQVQLLLADQRASLGVEQAKHSLALAESNLRNIRKSGVADEKEAIHAAREHRDAVNALADAQQSVLDIQTRLEQLQRGPSDKDKQRAALDQREAQLGLSEAQKEYADALKDSEHDYLRIQRASLAVEEAQMRLGDANDAVSGLQTQNAKDVEQAQRELKSAQDRLVDAQDRLNEGAAQSVKQAPDVIGATLAVKQAKFELANAIATARDTSSALDTSLSQINEIDTAGIRGQLTDVLSLLQSNGLSADDFLARLREIEVLGSAHGPGMGHLELAPSVTRKRDALGGKRIPNLPDAFGSPVPTPFGGSFAQGGIVPGAPGQPSFALVHGGERIIPNGGGGGQPINLTVNAMGDAQAIARAVRDELLRLKRNNVSSGL